MQGQRHCACEAQVTASPSVLVGVLIGGGSRRMGMSKSLLKVGGKFVLERIVSAALCVADEVVLIGSAPVPPALAGVRRLMDISGVEGPLAGILAAFRWRPDARWVMLACDMPFVSVEALRWLLEQTSEGTWGVLPHLDAPERREALFAVYEPPAAAVFESGAAHGVWSVGRLASGERFASPRVPARLRRAFVNLNTPDDLSRLTRP